MSDIPNNREIYSLTFKHCRSTQLLDSVLTRYVNISYYNGKLFEEIYPHIEHIFSTINGLGKLCVIDVTLDIMRYYGITDTRKFLVGSGDLEGIKRLGLEAFVSTIRVGNSKLKYIEKVYIAAAFSNY